MRKLMTKLALPLAAAALAFAAPAMAEYPERPIGVAVSYGAGGATDVRGAGVGACAAAVTAVTGGAAATVGAAAGVTDGGASCPLPFVRSCSAFCRIFSLRRSVASKSTISGVVSTSPGDPTIEAGASMSELTAVLL